MLVQHNIIGQLSNLQQSSPKNRTCDLDFDTNYKIKRLSLGQNI